MSDDTLVVARRLAVRLLHEAQISPEAPIEGLVGARDREPVSIYPLGEAVTRNELLQKLQAQGEQAWAWYRSNPHAAALPEASDKVVAADQAYSLIISLDTKGVLEMRCWDWSSGMPQERVLKIKD
jgi:hypothetical protein